MKIAVVHRAGPYPIVIITLAMLAHAQCQTARTVQLELVENPILEHGFNDGPPAPSSRFERQETAQPSVKLASRYSDSAVIDKRAVDLPNIANTQQAERVLGQKLASKFEPYSTFITDPRTTQYVNHLEETIVNNSALSGRYIVKVVDDVEINAFSLPGGFLYVNGGLILAAENEAQLVAALAHETAHITARHMTKLEMKKRIVGRLFLAGGPAGYAIRRLLGNLFLLKLARNAEFEADRLGLKYQHASGYDPTQLARLLSDVFTEPQKEGFFARLLDEHPLTGTRVNRAKRTIAHYFQPRSDYVVDTSDFHEIKMRVAAAMGVTDRDLSRVHGEEEDRQQATSCHR